MNEHDYCANWKQCRLFTNDFSLSGLWNIHKRIFEPIWGGETSTPFFATHYICTDSQDCGDTRIEELPPGYRTQDGKHFSIRVRFKNHEHLEHDLAEKADLCGLWYSDVRSYDPAGDLGGNRFMEKQVEELAERRASKLARLLHSNNMLLLDMLTESGATFSPEVNSHQLNALLGNPLQSVMHLLVNQTLLGSAAFWVGRTQSGDEVRIPI